MASFRVSVFALLFATGTAVASAQQEIEHLLDFVAGSDCKYERNGNLHDGLEARDHIRMKYDYYRDRVETAEDFIRYSATKSKISGRKYKIHCPGSGVINSGDWLLRELEQYRLDGAR